MEVLSEYELDGFVCFRDFCLIVSEKFSNEDDEFLIKAIFKSFKGSPIPADTNVKAAKHNFCCEAITFKEFRAGMRQLPEFVAEGNSYISKLDTTLSLLGHDQRDVRSSRC